MSDRYGLIAGNNFHGANVFDEALKETRATPYGPVTAYLADKWVYLPRHGAEGEDYVLPHRINHYAHMTLFREFGVQEVVGVYSVGSLRPSLSPGSLVIPDDWIDFGGPGGGRHLTPALSLKVRDKLSASAWKNKLTFENGGIYWQTRGPRLETKAEIKLMSNFADLVGMTMASEATAAQEFDLDFGALCSVDNYANGLSRPGLVYDDILKAARTRRGDILKILAGY